MKKPSFFHFQSLEERLNLTSRPPPKKSEAKPATSSVPKLEKVEEEADIEDARLREHCSYLKKVRRKIVRERLNFERVVTQVTSPYSS